METELRGKLEPMENQPVRCLIFDCDGTLVDSEFLSHVGFTQALSEIGVSLTPETSMERYRGGKLADMLQDAAGSTIDFAFEDFAARYYEIIAQIFEHQLEPVPGVQSVLAMLDLPMCVASNAPLAKTCHSLAITGLDLYFDDMVFSAYEVERWKPDPGLFLYAAGQMGYRPDECVVIEDSPVGVQAALSAGMRTIHFTNGTSESALEGVVQISSMAELPKFVGPAIQG